MQPASNTIQTYRYALIVGVITIGLLLQSGGARATSETVIPDVSIVATDGNGQRKLVEGQDGSMYIIYVAPLEGTDAIVVARSDDTGSNWERDELLSRPGIRAGLGSLAVDAVGTIHATWVDYETVGHVWYAARTGDTWTESIKISPGTYYAGFPVVVAGRDTVHVLWYSAPPDESYRHGSRYEIRHTYRTPQGWTEPVLVSVGSDDSLNPSAVADRQGNVHGAWYQLDDQSYRVNHSVWDTKRWTEPDAISPTDLNATQVAIDIAPDDAVYLVWGQFQAGVPAIAFARLDGDGWSAVEFLTQGPAADPVLTTDSEGNAVVAWSAGDQIVARRFDGERWLPPEDLGRGASPTFASSERVMMAWTRPAGAGYELVVSDLPASREATAVPVIIGSTALALILAAFALRRRRRTQPE